LQGVAEIIRPIQKDLNEDLKMGERFSNQVVQKLNTGITFKAVVQHEQLTVVKTPIKKLPRRKVSSQL
jgi:hypothetical protein